MANNIKKNDRRLLLGILAVAAFAFVGLRWYQGSHTEDAEAVVSIDGVEYGRFPLAQDRMERIESADGAYNVLVIRDGEADVTESSCPDGICVKHRKISLQNESIVCLPNKVVVEIKKGEAADMDVIAN